MITKEFKNFLIEKNLANEVLSELIDLQYNMIKIGVTANFFGAAIISYLLYGNIESYKLFGWSFCVFVVDVISLALCVVYKRIKLIKENINFWWSLSIFCIFIISSVGGSLGYLLISSTDFRHQFFIIFCLLIFSAGIAQGTVTNIISCRLSMSIVLVPLTIWCFQQQTSLCRCMAAVIIIYMLFLFVATNKYNKLLNQSLLLRFKNTALNERLEKSNQILEQKVTARVSELAQAKLEAETANKAKTEFLGIVSHELRTPLRSVNSGVKGIKKYLPSLIESYQIAKEANLVIPYIIPRQYDLLPSLLAGIEQETNSAFSFINMLLMNLGEIGSGVDQAEINCSMAQCIDVALERYPFMEGERQLVDWQQQQDFIFKGNELLMVHVIFNLLKNALQYIQEEGQGQIAIWLEPGEDNNILHFKDTAKGISVENLPHVFDRYFSRSKGGTGLGLAFCKMIMTSFGGTIACEAEEEVYTKFLLRLPSIP